MPNAQKGDSVLIVGAGVFGLSLAYELAARRGYTNVTVLDRYLPPVVDGSSVDISRIIRSDYADPLYAKIGREAVDGWRGPDYSPFYHETGFAMITTRPEHPYIAGATKALKDQGAGGKLIVFDHQHADRGIKARYPGVETDLRSYMASLNPEGGWADAAGSIRALAERATLAGVSFATGKNGTVVQLEYKGSHVAGVHVASGAYIPADRVVLATGAWTDALVNGMSHAVLASAQPVGFIQLTPKEAEALTQIPVMTNMDSGVFCFPPTPDSHVIKVARHGYGYTTQYCTGGREARMVSTPQRDSNNARSHFLPEDAEEALRNGIRHFFPSIAERPWMKKRLCWYTNTPAGDFVVDNHPGYKGLFIATGGSGHGFKFLPVLGKYIADCFEGTAPESLRAKWRLQPGSGKAMDMPGDGSRAGPPLRALKAQEQAKL